MEGADQRQIVPEPIAMRPNVSRPSGPWTKDEEDALWQLVSVYPYNWDLIVESLNSGRLGSAGIRTTWCCFDKYAELKAANFEPHGKADFIYSASQSSKKEKKVKVLGLLSTFGYISGLTKKRDANKQPAKSNKQVNLTAHDTHIATQQNAGIDVNAPPLSSVELSRLKEQRDKIFEQNRQNAYYAQHARQMQIPVRAAPHPGMNASFRPAARPQMNALSGISQQPMGQFRPQFSPQQQQMQLLQQQQALPQQMRMGSNYTQEQIQTLMLQQRLIARQQGQGMDTTGMNQFNNAARLGRPMTPQPQRSQMQADMSTAAAFVALQNAQNAAKQSVLIFY